MLIRLSLRASALALVTAAAGCGSSGGAPGGGSSGGSASGGSGGGPGGPGGGAMCAEATTLPRDVVDATGAIVADDYRLLAAHYGAEDGLRYRFGESAGCYHPTPLSRPPMYQPPDKICLAPGNYGSGFLYQVGADPCPTANPGDYSSTQGIALYAPDGADDGGVNILQVLAEGFNTFQDKPQTSWTLGSPIPWQLADAGWLGDAGGAVKTPIAAARSYRAPNGELNVNALTVFQSGLMGAFGENTGGSGWHTRLPDGLLPTAIAITNGSELALVTLWDPQNLAGKLAVYAMTSCEEGKGPMCLPDPSLLSGYAIQHQAYPGFVNDGRFTGGKLLGLIDLPELHAPTAISATSNYLSGWWTKGGANTSVSNFDFSVEADRQTFVAGENSARYSSAGFAVITSLSEKKAAFVDLKPLFAFYKKMYFGDQASFAATRLLGDGPHEWPYTFADTPEQTPTVLTTLALDDRPTAVVTARYKAHAGDPGYDALIATRGGTLESYGVGGLVDGTGAVAGDVRAIGTILIGRNPTSLTYRKEHVWSGNDPLSGNPDSVTRSEVIVVSRGDQEIEFVKLDGVGATGSIYQRLTDGALVDPVAVEDSDTHGTESYVLTVADFGGRQIVNYRFGPVILHTNGGASYGMGPDGKAPFERGGTFAVTGKPFAFSSANVP